MSTLTVTSIIKRSPRVAQIEGLFDLPAAAVSTVTWNVDLPLEARAWRLGLIVGPSGCGKSTVARALWPEEWARGAALAWPCDAAVVDAFPETLPVKDLAALLSAVGFASPPAWLRPFQVLSTGEQFRATLARLLAETADLVVLDEFTSVVDRTVARLGSAALAKTVRARQQRFVAVTCHEDVEEWLQPDWTYRPATGTFTWRSLQRRPAIALAVGRCALAAWALFRRHHYLSSDPNPFARAFLATWEGQPVAFSAWIHHLVKGGGMREHRTVVLPDYQGAGIGLALSSFCAALWKARGQRAVSTTTHPALIQSRMRSSHWRLTRAPALAPGGKRRDLKHATTRLTAGFEYVGPALDRVTAQALMAKVS